MNRTGGSRFTNYQYWKMAEKFELILEPDKTLVFEGPHPPHSETVAINLAVKNPTDAVKAYKLKCTDNSLFQIYPAVGILKPGASENLKIKSMKSTPPTRKHHFVLFHMDPPAEVATGRKAWEGYKGKESRKSLSVEWRVKKAEGANAPAQAAAANAPVQAAAAKAPVQGAVAKAPEKKEEMPAKEPEKKEEKPEEKKE